MNSDEINAIAEIIARHVTASINKDILDIRKDVDEHQRILKGKNGDPSLPEMVRANTRSIRNIYAGLGFVGGAFVIEFIAWIVPKVELLIKSAP